MKRLATKLIVALVLCVSAPALAQQTLEKPFNETFLQSVDIVPTKEQLEAYPGDVRAELEAAATDESLSLYERRRAISLSGHYLDDRTRTFFGTLAGHSNPEIRKTAYYSMARAFGPQADAALVASVSAGLKDDNEDVREWAVRGLRWVVHRDALSTLQRLVDSDDESLARIAQRALKKHVGVSQPTVQ